MSAKDCSCETCHRRFHHLGITRHRAMHRDKKENCTIIYSDGKRVTHIFNADIEINFLGRGKPLIVTDEF